MSSTPPRPPGVDAIATLRAWGHRLWSRRRGESPRPAATAGGDPLLESGSRLRAAREARGLSLRQLALETRISTAVLEALEKGWRDRLPEPTYLRTMLALLEQHLALESGSLEMVLPPRRAGGALRSGARSRRIPIGSIEVFGTWQGVLLYGLLCFGLLYGLNRQQQQLAARGLLSLRPIPPLPVSTVREESRGESSHAGAGLLQAHPELRPLERARRGQALARLRRDLEQTRRAASGRAADGAAATGRAGTGRSGSSEVGSSAGRSGSTPTGAGNSAPEGQTGSAAQPAAPTPRP